MKEKLKGLKKFLGCTIIVIAIAATLAVSCENLPWYNNHSENYDAAESSDSVLLAEQIESLANPVFITVEDMVTFQAKVIEDYSVDSVFKAMPEQVLTNVTSVLIKRCGQADKRSVVEEYRANSAVYDNLPTQAPQDSPNEKEGKIISTSYKYRVDTVDGNPVTVKVKTEESYAE